MGPVPNILLKILMKINNFSFFHFIHNSSRFYCKSVVGLMTSRICWPFLRVSFCSISRFVGFIGSRGVFSKLGVKELLFPRGHLTVSWNILLITVAGTLCLEYVSGRWQGYVLHPRLTSPAPCPNSLSPKNNEAAQWGESRGWDTSCTAAAASFGGPPRPLPARNGVACDKDTLSSIHFNDLQDIISWKEEQERQLCHLTWEIQSSIGPEHLPPLTCWPHQRVA